MQDDTSILYFCSRSVASLNSTATLASAVKVHARSVSFLVASLAVPPRTQSPFFFLLAA